MSLDFTEEDQRQQHYKNQELAKMYFEKIHDYDAMSDDELVACRLTLNALHLYVLRNNEGNYVEFKNFDETRGEVTNTYNWLMQTHLNIMIPDGVKEELEKINNIRMKKRYENDTKDFTDEQKQSYNELLKEWKTA